MQAKRARPRANNCYTAFMAKLEVSVSLIFPPGAYWSELELRLSPFTIDMCWTTRYAASHYLTLSLSRRQCDMESWLQRYQLIVQVVCSDAMACMRWPLTRSQPPCFHGSHTQYRRRLALPQSTDKWEIHVILKSPTKP